MKTEEKAEKVQNIATALAAIFGAVGAFFGIFQAQVSADLKNQVTSLQNASQQTIVNVISTLGDDAQAADLAQSGDTVAITEQLINVYNSTKDQNAALTSETQTLQSENAALQEQVENLKSVLLNTYSMDEIDTVVAQGYLDEVETKRLDNLELLDSERCEQVASVRDLYGTTHSVSYKFDPWQEAWAKFKLDGRYDTFEANILTSDDTSRDANISVEIYVDDVLVGRVDNIVRDENVRPISGNGWGTYKTSAGRIENIQAAEHLARFLEDSQLLLWLAPSTFVAMESKSTLAADDTIYHAVSATILYLTAQSKIQPLVYQSGIPYYSQEVFEKVLLEMFGQHLDCTGLLQPVQIETHEEEAIPIKYPLAGAAYRVTLLSQQDSSSLYAGTPESAAAPSSEATVSLTYYLPSSAQVGEILFMPGERPYRISVQSNVSWEYLPFCFLGIEQET